jgi:hypothetical protein
MVHGPSTTLSSPLFAPTLPRRGDENDVVIARVLHCRELQSAGVTARHH